MAQFPNTDTADGIWTLKKVRRAILGNNWPAFSWTVDLSNVTYDSVSFSIGAQEVSPRDLCFNNDGTKMFMCGISGDDVNEYALSTAFDITSASFTTVLSVDVGNTQGLTFNNDGTELYVVGSTDSVRQYTLSTAFDISTASDTFNFSVQTQDSQPTNVQFNDTGTKMYVCGSNTDSVIQYDLSVAFDLSTASYSGTSFSVSSEMTVVGDVSFNTNGKKMYLVGDSAVLYQYSLSTAYDISTASYDSVSFDASSEESAASGVFFKQDGTKMYLIGETTDSIYQYSTGL